MSESVMDDQIIEAADGTVALDAPADEPAASIADHAKQFGAQAKKDEPQIDAKAAADLKPIRPVDQQRRDQGKFTEGKQRMRAKDAVERINVLTGRAKTAEERATALEGDLRSAREELKRLSASPSATNAQIERAETKVDTAKARVQAQPAGGPSFPEAEPDEQDPKFGGDYAKYLRAVAGYEGRKAQWEYQQTQREESQRQQQMAAEQEVNKSFGERVTAAKEKYPDYEDVALRQNAAWLAPNGKPLPHAVAIDAFVMQDESGADVLYYLQSHPDETDALLGMNPLQQVKRMTLLSQRFGASPPSAQAGSTGAASGRQVVQLPPRPPTPVRTEAQRASGAPLPTDGSLSIAEHAKAFGGKARR